MGGGGKIESGSQAERGKKAFGVALRGPGGMTFNPCKTLFLLDERKKSNGGPREA